MSVNKFIRRQIEKRSKKVEKQIDGRISRLASKLNRMRNDQNAGNEGKIADEKLKSLLKQHGIELEDFEDNGVISDTYYLENSVPDCPNTYYQHQEVVAMQIASYLGINAGLMIEPSSKMLVFSNDTISNISLYRDMIQEILEDLTVITKMYNSRQPSEMEMMFHGILYRGTVGNGRSGSGKLDINDEDSFKIGVFDFLFSKLQSMKEDIKLDQKPIASIEEQVIIAGEISYDPSVVNEVPEQPQEEPQPQEETHEHSTDVVPTENQEEHQEEQPKPKSPTIVNRVPINSSIMRAGMMFAVNNQQTLKSLQD